MLNIFSLTKTFPFQRPSWFIHCGTDVPYSRIFEGKFHEFHRLIAVYENFTLEMCNKNVYHYVFLTICEKSSPYHNLLYSMFEQ